MGLGYPNEGPFVVDWEVGCLLHRAIQDTIRAPYNTTGGRDCVKSLRICLPGTCPQRVGGQVEGGCGGVKSLRLRVEGSGVRVEG